MKKILISFIFCLTVLSISSVALKSNAQPMTLIDLVNLFISLGIISAEKADAAKAAINTVSSSTNINISGSWSCTSSAIKRTITFQQNVGTSSYTGKTSDGYFITGNINKINLIDSWAKESYSSNGSGTISSDGTSYKATWKDKKGNTGNDVCKKNINSTTTKASTSSSPVSISLKNGDGYILNSQYVVGGTSIVGLSYNFTTSVSSVVIKKLDFIVDDGITFVTVGNIKMPVVSGKVTVTGFNILVPVNSVGINIPVTLAFANIGTGGVSSNSTTTIKLNTFGYSIDNGPIITASSSKDLISTSSVFYIVSSKPTISLVQPSTTYFNSGNAEVARIVVATDLKGPIKVDSIPISSTVMGNGTFDGYTVKVDSNIIPSTVTNGVISFSDGYDIASGSLVTFCIYSKIDLKFRSSLITKLGAASLFKWTDVNGEISLDASLIPNYPINSASVTNGD